MIYCPWNDIQFFAFSWRSKSSISRKIFIKVVLYPCLRSPSRCKLLQNYHFDFESDFKIELEIQFEIEFRLKFEFESESKFQIELEIVLEFESEFKIEFEIKIN